MTNQSNKVKQKATIDKDPKREVSKDGMLKDPKLVAIKCCLPTKKTKTEILELDEISKTANRVKTYLTIETEGADNSNFYANITLECNAWKNTKQTYSLNVEKTNKTKLHEQDIYHFIPDEKDWADPKIKTAKLKIKVVLTSIGRKSKFSNNHSLNPDFYPIFTYNSLELEIDLDYCGHGMEYREDIIRAKGKKGPVYYGITTMKSYDGWSDLLKDKIITEDEKDIICAMSENEGNFEAVQSWDSEFVSLGAMQKTIKADGTGIGELPIQIIEFKDNWKSSWEKYVCCFEHHQLTFENKHAKYKGNYPSITDKNDIRKNYLDNDTSKEECILEPFIKLGYDKDFKTKQVSDFIKTLKDTLVETRYNIYDKPLKSYLTSSLGKALVLDHKINRPHCVGIIFKAALDQFLEEENKDKEEKDKISSDPSTWGDNHANYETKILDIYGPLRGTMCHKMTNAAKRYNDLKRKLE